MEDIMHYMLNIFNTTTGFIVNMIAAIMLLSMEYWLDRVLTKRGKYVLLVILLLALALYLYRMFH